MKDFSARLGSDRLLARFVARELVGAADGSLELLKGVFVAFIVFVFERCLEHRSQSLQVLTPSKLTAPCTPQKHHPNPTLSAHEIKCLDVR